MEVRRRRRKRGNPYGDRHLRQLERAAARDPQARLRLARELFRRGEGSRVKKPENYWAAAILGDRTAAEITGWQGSFWNPHLFNVGPNEWQAAQPINDFLDLISGARVKADPRWPQLTKRRQHKLACAFAWACALASKPLFDWGWARFMQDFGSRRALTEDRIPEDEPSYWRNWGPFEWAAEVVQRYVFSPKVRSKKPSVLGRLRSLESTIREDLSELLQEVYLGSVQWEWPWGRPVEYPMLDLGEWEQTSWESIAYVFSGQWGETEVNQTISGGNRIMARGAVYALVVLLDTYNAVLSSMSAKYKRVVFLPASGWEHDRDIPLRYARGIPALAFAVSAFSLAVEGNFAAHHERPRDAFDPARQDEIFRGVAKVLIPPLMDGRI